MKDAEHERRWIWIALAAGLLLQVAAAVFVWRISHGREFAQDTRDFVRFVNNPWMTFTPEIQTKSSGGEAAAPLMPALYAGPVRLASLALDSFLSYRFTAIVWMTIGLGFAWSCAIGEFGGPRSKGEFWAGLILVAMPISWIASAIFCQDDCVAGGWSGLTLWAWRRWGPTSCAWMAALGFWCAKILCGLYLVALWIAYPNLRIRIFLIASGLAVAFVGFLYWRDGHFSLAGHAMSAMNSGTWYSLVWLLFFAGDQSHGEWFEAMAKRVSLPITAGALGGWIWFAYRREFSLPVAVVVSYTLFFTCFVGMMPEYELWYVAWVVYLLWAVAKRRDYLTFFAGWSHSAFGYGYKLVYSCDSQDFVKGKGSVLESYYAEHFGFNLRWMLMALAIGTIASGLLFAWRIARHDPTATDSTANDAPQAPGT